MSTTVTNPLRRPASGRPPRLTVSWTLALSALLFLAGAVLLPIALVRPPRPLPANTPADQFAAARAMGHVTAIASAPRPIGTPAHDAAQAYIIDQLQQMGLRPELQPAVAIQDPDGSSFLGASLTNIVARLPGTAPTKAVLLASHYDSVPTGPGAADDGIAVANLLETARALKEGPPLKNDVIFLFTDGEELGTLGAKAYVTEHPWARETGLVLNFETRGIGGPVFMFETKSGNGWLINEFAKAAPYPVADSVMNAIYQRMPNSTDYTDFKAAGYAGLNFGAIGGGDRYHTQVDNPQAIDPGTLQHQGAYALALTRHFGNLPLDQMPPDGDAIYFDILGLLVHYPSAWAMPLGIVALLLLAGVAVVGCRRKRLTAKGTAAGFATMLLAVLATAGMVLAVSALLEPRIYAGQIPFVAVDFYLVSSAAPLVAVSGIFGLARRWVSLADLALGTLLWWMLGTVGTIVLLPAASHVATWPLLCGSLALLVLVTMPDPTAITGRSFALLCAAVLPALLYLSPVAYFIMEALPTVPAGAILATLSLGLVGPQIAVICTKAPGSLLAGGGLVLAGALAAALFVGPSAAHPRMDQVYYVLTPANQTAIWGSDVAEPDAWSRQFFGADTQKGRAIQHMFRGGEQLQAPAPYVGMAAPTAAVVEDRTENGERLLRLRLRSERQAPGIEVLVPPNTPMHAVRLNGQPLRTDLPAGRTWQAYYFGLPAEGVELSLRLPPGQPFAFRLTDMSYGLPAIPGQPIMERPPELMPGGWLGDLTMVSQVYRF